MASQSEHGAMEDRLTATSLTKSNTVSDQRQHCTNQDKLWFGALKAAKGLKFDSGTLS